MDDFLVRLAFLARAIVPFVFMMATVYLAAHIVFGRLVPSPQSQVLSFFAIVTAPLVRPVRVLLPAGTAEPRVRAIAFAVYLVLWLVTDRLSRALGPAASG